MPTVIKLNVGGKAFLTSRQTVEREPDSMLARLCLGDLGSYEVGSGPLEKLFQKKSRCLRWNAF